MPENNNNDKTALEFPTITFSRHLVLQTDEKQNPHYTPGGVAEVLRPPPRNVPCQWNWGSWSSWSPASSTAARKIKTSNCFYHLFSPKFHLSSDFACAASIPVPLGRAVCVTKSCSLHGKCPSSIFLLKKKMHFLPRAQKEMLSGLPCGFCLYCKQPQHKSAPSFPWFLPGTILSCGDSLWGPEGDV